MLRSNLRDRWAAGHFTGSIAEVLRAFVFPAVDAMAHRVWHALVSSDVCFILMCIPVFTYFDMDCLQGTIDMGYHAYPVGVVLTRVYVSDNVS